jgi:RNA polymerase sigma factor (sigma-70 family)
MTQPEPRNPLEVLGLTPTSVRTLGLEWAVKLAKRIARERLRRNHPDLFGDRDEFDKALQAYEELKSPKDARACASELEHQLGVDSIARKVLKEQQEEERGLMAAAALFEQFVLGGGTAQDRKVEPLPALSGSPVLSTALVTTEQQAPGAGIDNPLEVLGLTPSCVRDLGWKSAVKFARRYARAKMKQLHPDRSGEKEAYKQVSQAYETLKDPKAAKGWARQLRRKPAWHCLTKEAQGRILRAEEGLEAAVTCFVEFVLKSRVGWSGTITISGGHSHRTLTVEDGRITSSPALTGYTVLSASVVGTFKSPPAPFVETLTGAPRTFPIRFGKSGKPTDEAVAILKYLKSRLRPYDPLCESTLVSLYFVEQAKGEDQKQPLALFGFEGVVAGWTGTPLPVDDARPVLPSLSGPDILRTYGEVEFMRLVDRCVGWESEKLPANHREDFKSHALMKMFELVTTKYRPEEASLAAFVRGCVPNLRMKYFNQVVKKEQRIGKGKNRVQEQEVADPDDPSGDSRQIDALLRKEESDQVKQMISRLSETLFDVAWKKWVDGKDNDEIASELGLDPNLVKSRIDDARKKLAKWLRPRRQP